jgi:hypothetical protein
MRQFLINGHEVQIPTREDGSISEQAFNITVSLR